MKKGEGSNAEEDNKKGVLAPFLEKCYEMVEDPVTDSVISWSSSGGSFVIRDMILFQRDLLPKHFKHGNFSSFLRQLNTYGFRKSDPDRWEFENNHFTKGQKHLLRNIGRRKQTKSHSQQKEPEQKKTPVGACIEVGMFGLHQEVEMLKRDKNVLMQELVKCRQQQNSADYKLQGLRQSIRKMEKDQQQMLSLLVMAMQSPGFLAQLLQQNDNNWCIAETRKKRRLPALEQGTEEEEHVDSDCQIVTYEPSINEQGTKIESVASDGQIVSYHSRTDETQKPLLMSMSNMDETEELNPSVDDFFMNIDFMSFGDVSSLLKEADLISSERENQFVLPDVPEDDGMLDQLLYDSPHSVDTDEMELNTPSDLDTGMGNEFTNDDTGMESIQSLDLVTKQLERLASDTSNTDIYTIK